MPPAACRLPPAACRLPLAASHLPPAACRLPPPTCTSPALDISRSTLLLSYFNSHNPEAIASGLFGAALCAQGCSACRSIARPLERRARTSRRSPQPVHTSATNFV
eukprot:7385532-Prymnesium_polylepis.1